MAAEKAAHEVDDELLGEAVRVVREYQHASVSLLQRRLKVWYSRAARLMDQLEERGVVGPAVSTPHQAPLVPGWQRLRCRCSALRALPFPLGLSLVPLDAGSWERKNAPMALAFLLCFPWSVFYGAMYSEAHCLFLTLATFVSYERKQWKWASCAAFLLSLCRPTGILIVPCLILLRLNRQDTGLRTLAPPAAGVFGLSLFAFYQYLVFGTPLATMKAAAVAPWSRTFSQALADLSLHGRPGLPPWYLVIMLVVGVVLLAIVPFVHRYLGAPYALFAVLSILLPSASGIVSLEWYVAVDFPIFVALALVRNRLVLFALLTFQVWFLMFFTAAFEAGWGIF